MAPVSGDVKPELRPDVKIERLSAVSLRRTIEPDLEVTGELGAGAVLPPELLAGEQQTHMVRHDVDPTALADGLVTIVLALLIGILQTGGRPQPERAPGVIAVLEAALRPPS